MVKDEPNAAAIASKALTIPHTVPKNPNIGAVAMQSAIQVIFFSNEAISTLAWASIDFSTPDTPLLIFINLANFTKTLFFNL